MGYKYIQTTYLGGWFLATVIWHIVRISNLESGEYLHSQHIIFFAITWLVQGFLYGILFYLITSYITKRVRFYQLLGIALLTQLFVALIIIATLYPLLNEFDIEKMPDSFSNFMTLPTIVLGTMYSLIVNTLISITMSAKLILGPGVLKNIIVGKYYTPIKEEHIFMFLDLQDSTAIAEKLGHLKFSIFIQDCFYELSVFNKHRGIIHKYVGDEAIITWPTKLKTNPLSAIKAFYEFSTILNNKSVYFKNKYGVQPAFKAGLHVGDVTVTEIGKAKREIAFLGDTVNTTARIQAECNQLKSDLLISGNIQERITLKDDYNIEEKGSYILRGKNEPIKIYAVNLKNAN
ncbi:adenylate/guanylate cyclase domain-containing protein [Saccharicrinis aurantiacus]|uniref:adenylate/guanylate cyclase domain-containing protein n=1 Tax=Saccharicrinis aurantiacus TaxID=1849719 RepID=UPI000838559A|nr:adenylate/guanylate cyclase domain-containing protein [Saccharicrinis aurantiacus]